MYHGREEAEQEHVDVGAAGTVAVAGDSGGCVTLEQA